MSELFLKIVNMSISASWLILAVLGLRLVLKKVPKWVHVLLWGIVAVRLLFPFSIESSLSLIPSAETIPETALSGSGFDIQTGIASVDERVNGYLGDYYVENAAVPENNSLTITAVLGIIWLIGIAVLAAYTAVSYGRLHRRVDTAVLLRENILQSESVISPFVLGIIKPRIYLPFKIAERDMEYVIAHEAAHIRRKDHWWKPLGFLLLTIHWFNPLMWIAYVLLCRDIELACDEKVIQELGNKERADYTQALVACSVNRRMIAACPLAFGEVGVKERVKSVMNYKKPALWIIILAMISCAVVAVCFLTDPVKAVENQPSEDHWDMDAEAHADPTTQTRTQEVERQIAALEADLSRLKAEEAALRAEVEAQEANHRITLLLKAIESSPTGISDSENHIREHEAEFNELVNYGAHTLRYCFSALLSGGQLALRNRIMASACHEIAVQWGDELLMIASSDASNSEWFVEYQERAMHLSGQYSEEEFREMYPASWILLQMINE